MQNHAIIWGLTVIGLNPFRYKIVSLSKSRSMDRNRKTFVCEVFDSDTFMWKRIKNMRLPKTDGLIRPKPVEAYGCLHWQTWNNNVVRFCPKTEVWSNFPLPNLGEFPALVNYEGKLGVVRRWIDYSETNRLWVLKNKLWEKVKDFNDMGVIVDVIWTPSNDVVMLSSRDRVCFYNTNTEKLKIVKDLANSVCFPFCSDYERVDLNRAYNIKQCCMFFLGLTLLSLCVP
ncbi:hypothetical protein V5N11_010432 [Cardamine amara subsp. amara]|uniref:Uncharacterized protein n=1 Tax=Cardamine amara subsp. amara TaxID=228776 RepID=A0ABD1C9E6_CARAN